MYLIPLNAQNKVLIYLERYLNEILKLNPPLKEDGIFDLNTDGAAVLRFKREYNLRAPARKLVETPYETPELWAAIGEMLGKDRLKQELTTLENQAIINLLQGLPISIPIAYTAEMKTCDEKFAALFGGEGSAAATFIDIDVSKDNEFKGRTVDRSAHLYKSGVFHLYTDNKGSDKEVELFVPKEAVFVPFARKTVAEYYSEGEWKNEFVFRFDTGKYKGVSIHYVHVAGTYGGQYGGAFLGKEFINPKNELTGKENAAKTSIQIGYIGGLGGSSGKGKLYRHCHIVVKKNGSRVDPRKIFC